MPMLPIYVTKNTMKDKTVKSIVSVAAFTALIAVGAIFSIPAPWNPVVPMTMATLFVLLAGMILGPWLGVAAVSLYLFLGAIGMPVFASGRGGFQILAGPTGGFLLGYVLAVILAGLTVVIGRRTLPALIIAAILGTIAIYIPGLPWLYNALQQNDAGMTWSITWSKYAAPFLIGDGVKAVAAVAVTYFLRNRVTANTVS